MSTFYISSNILFSFIRCDADPAALAKYVYALVKKDKTLEELRGGMVEQLDVFLQNGIFIYNTSLLNLKFNHLFTYDKNILKLLFF